MARIDKQKAMDVVEFIPMLKLVDDFYGQPFILQDWQYEVLWDVYGTVNEQGYRQYRYAYLEIPKKNGKTTLIGALGVYHLVCDPPQGQIYCCAADKKQAGLVYKAAVAMIDQDEELGKILKVKESTKEIFNLETGTIFTVLSAEAYTKHGINPTVVIFDELHAQPNRELWDVMTFGAGVTRKEPLWWVITTAGDDPDRNSIGWEIHDQAIKLRDGELIDPTWYVKVYGIEEDDDIFDEEVWYRVNPSLGHAIPIEALRSEALAARNSEASEKLFRWLRLNQWVSLKQHSWQPLSLWDSTNGDWDLSELIGKRCYPGLDLGSTTDLTAACYLFPPQDGIDDWRFIFDAWIPDENMKERVRRDKVPYDRWVNQKFLHATPGDVMDYEFVEARLLLVNKQYDIQALGTDPWESRMLTQRLMNEGIEVVEIGQNMKHMSPSMKMIERLMKSGKMTHEKNPLARWCWGNTVIAIDGNENIKPMKNKSHERIDLTVALVNAMATAMLFEEDIESVYDRRGLLSI
ncbi:terminase large subunit [Sporosarcina newyorkensis]|uniref:Phage terminase-like protein, large subunit, contains N-terminal HTH domain n=1 Tax=Sporosarcina newyorkensis TaxID=759851 RepID=A0A1T4YV22_9BACL|nr:terminase TerL endonuclease subunit [Sporosarcina newyorkensis]SKB05141.1 Phage terminase-like protein, large subunit, contains N-terminal HTH domain [Sporosarcina newyorkensis]